MSTSLDCKILAFFCQARVPGMKPHTEVMILTLGPSCSEVHVMTYSVRTCAAKALIPDDDDEELIEKAKANRKTRLETEKVAEKEYAKTGGFADSEVVAVQASAALGLLASFPSLSWLPVHVHTALLLRLALVAEDKLSWTTGETVIVSCASLQDSHSARHYWLHCMWPVGGSLESEFTWVLCLQFAPAHSWHHLCM